MGYTSAGVPAAGSDEVQTITTTGTPAGGTFRLAFAGLTTAAIAFNAAAATVQAALVAVPSIGAGGVVCAGGPLPTGVTVTFSGTDLGKKVHGALTAVDVALTGGTNPAVAIARTTPGVDATGRGAAKGAQLTDLTNGVLYINTGTPQAPTWTKVGLQT